MCRKYEKLIEVPMTFGRGILKSLVSSKIGMDCITATATWDWNVFAFLVLD